MACPPDPQGGSYDICDLGGGAVVWRSPAGRDGARRRKRKSPCKGCWRLVIQRTVRPLLVVLLLPRRDLSPRVPQVFKPIHVQGLIPQLAVETFHVPVLLRLARLDVLQLDSLLDAPPQKMPPGELRPIFATNRYRFIPLRQNHLQRPRP